MLRSDSIAKKELLYAIAANMDRNLSYVLNEAISLYLEIKGNKIQILPILHSARKYPDG
ncbi:MAG: hypothetical protein F6K10_42700 [Moorea sp. SIO2B7]|nr:hypothetical protein [Moorena sp. SIO2B7]